MIIIIKQIEISVCIMLTRKPFETLFKVIYLHVSVTYEYEQIECFKLWLYLRLIRVPNLH